MKELTIEEKAKAYDEAIDKVAHFIKKHIGLGCMIHPNSSEAKELFNIFPELKESESEGERIRKEILDYIIKGSESLYDVQQYGKERFEKWIAWLEKQGEHKPAWSEEDEIMFRKAIITIDNVRIDTDSQEYYQGICDWLKSLKDRYIWKPSDEQMDELRKHSDNVILRNLYYSLKKLK